MAPSDDRIMSLFKYCQKAFASEGYTLSFPANTDPKTTYKWRYLKDFSQRIDKLEISDQTTYQLILAIVKYAKSKKQLRRGLSILLSDKLFELGYEAIEQKQQAEGSILSRVKKDKVFMESFDDPLEQLTKIKKEGGLPNIVLWYIQGRLSIAYLALSKKCSMAMRSLNKEHRSLLPNGKELVATRFKIIDSAITKARLKLVIDKDWYI